MKDITSGLSINYNPNEWHLSICHLSNFTCVEASQYFRFYSGSEIYYYLLLKYYYLFYYGENEECYYLLLHNI